MAQMTVAQALGDIAFYNGWEKELEQVREYIKNQYENGNGHLISIPEFLYGYDVDGYIRVVWSCMVLMFGDYGVSPRVGHINHREANEAMEFLDEIIAQIPEELKN